MNLTVIVKITAAMHSSTFIVPLFTITYLTYWLKVGEGKIVSNCAGRKIVPHVQNGLPTRYTSTVPLSLNTYTHLPTVIQHC